MTNNLGNEFRFLKFDEICGDNELEIIKKYGFDATMTDFSILLGGKYEVTKTTTNKVYNNGCWWIDPKNDLFYICRRGQAPMIDFKGTSKVIDATSLNIGARPCIPYSFIKDECIVVKDGTDTCKVLFGEYPQMIVGKQISDKLEKGYKMLELSKKNGKENAGLINMQRTGKEYSTLEHNPLSDSISIQPFEEYECDGKKYIRFTGYPSIPGQVLSNYLIVYPDTPYWIKVEPITWIVDKKSGIALSEKILFSGVEYDTKKRSIGGPRIKQFMQFHFSHEILCSKFSMDVSSVNNGKESLNDNNFENHKVKKITLVNPFDFESDDVSEEDIILGCIESGVPVFLHGPSSEGKSARVKQIDPKLIKLSLAGITPEKLNGRSVYNSLKDTMEDKKPTWLERLEEVCVSEPDFNHILFLDEISNALPSIQGMVYHLVLDREVNDRWPLPDNARIVLAGNEMKDSLAANRIVEPLFNRCAHVYIETSLFNWLVWASRNKIHPSIISFMSYKNGQALRSKFDGEKPNADPRKWEMASKVLYSTGQPEMIRSLVGEEITREFCEFCNQKVITLDNVLKGKYDDEYLNNLNTAEKYVTVVGLLCVDNDNVEVVRNFVRNLGGEFVSVFDSIWSSGSDERLEIIAEMRMKQKVKKL